MDRRSRISRKLQDTEYVSRVEPFWLTKMWGQFDPKTCLNPTKSHMCQIHTDLQHQVWAICDGRHERIDPFSVKKLAIFGSSDFCKINSIRTAAVNLVSKQPSIR